MPVIEGKVHRSRFTSLKLRELSSVDNPAQPGARMAIMKRDFNAKDRQRLADSGAALPDGCLSGDTLVETPDGPRPIAALAGKCKLLTDKGWKDSEVRCFGKQVLWKVTVVRNGLRRTVMATPNHRWYTGRGVRLTRDLLVGDAFPHVSRDVLQSHDLDPAQGAIAPVAEKAADSAIRMVMIVGERSPLSPAGRMHSSPSRREPIADAAATTLGRRHLLKDLLIDSVFTAKYPVPAYQPSGVSDTDLRGRIRRVFALTRLALSSVAPTPHGELGGRSDCSAKPAFDFRDGASDWRDCPHILSDGDAWVIAQVTATEIVEPVYCGVVPELHRFALAGGVLTGNSYPIETVGDLGNAVQAFGRAKNPGKAKTHIISRARSLDALDKLPEEWNVKKFTDAAEIAKYVGDGDEGAQSFQDVLAANNFSQNVWPCVDALSQSIRSSVGDKSLAGGERDAQIDKSVQQFLQSVRDISPDVSKQLEPLLVRKRDDQMAKTVEELQSEVEKLTSKLAIATADVEAQKALVVKATAAQTAAEEAAETAAQEAKETKKQLLAATDETIKYGGEEIKKSEAGDGPFKAMKAMHAGEQTARLVAKAAQDFPHVVGTPTEKALVLKTIDGLADDDPTKKALEAILTSAEKMVAAGFDRIGGGGGATPTEKAAQGTFKAKVAEIRKRDEISENAAMTKARSEFPAEFAAAYPESAPAEQPAN